MPKMLLIMPTLVAMTLGAGFQLARHLGNLEAAYPHHAWVVASYVIVGIMAVIALGLLEPANLAVLFELKKPHPNGARIQRLMKVFIYTAGITGLMQIADHLHHDVPGEPLSATTEVTAPGPGSASPMPRISARPTSRRSCPSASRRWP